MSGTADTDKIAAAPSGVAAYYRDRERDGDGMAPDAPITYRLTQNVDTLIETPVEDLQFVRLDMSGQEVAALFQSRYPVPHELLTNIVVHHSAAAGPLPSRIVVQPARYWYTGEEPAAVCRVARAMDKPIQVTGAWRDKQWLQGAYRYPRLAALHEAGCYLRVAADGETHVVYNPKVAGRRLRRGGALREIRYVTCREFVVWAAVMYRWNCECLPPLMEHNEWMMRRAPVLRMLRRDLILFELLYGREAYWQLEEFRELVKLWKCKGSATWAEFRRTAGYHTDFRGVFEVLDEAADRKRRPRKRALRPKLPKEFRWRRP